MTLSDFLNLPDQSATALAAKIGCEVSTITRLAKGERRPSLDLALRIETETDGLVRVGDIASIFHPQEAGR